MWTKHVKQRFSVIENQEIQGHSASERRNKQYKLHDCTILLPKERCKPWRDPSQLPEMNRCHGGVRGADGQRCQCSKVKVPEKRKLHQISAKGPHGVFIQVLISTCVRDISDVGKRIIQKEQRRTVRTERVEKISYHQSDWTALEFMEHYGCSLGQYNNPQDLCTYYRAVKYIEQNPIVLTEIYKSIPEMRDFDTPLNN